MGPVPRTLELFYDVLSPYSWLCFEVLCRYQKIWNIKLQLQPTLIAGVMKDSGRREKLLGWVDGGCCKRADLNGLEELSSVGSLYWHLQLVIYPLTFTQGSSKPGTLRSFLSMYNSPLPGNKPPAMLPRKGQYLKSELNLLKQQFQVPLQFPKDFFSVILEKGSISAMRFLTAVNMENPGMLEKVSRELWMRVWARDEDISEPQSILAAAEKAGLSAEQAQGLLAMTSTAEVKKKLMEVTDIACKYGAFGLPVTVAHVDGQTHMLFGSDRMELLAYLLGEKWMGPVPPALNARL